MARKPTEREEITVTEAGRRLGLTSAAIAQWAARPGAPVVTRQGKKFCRWPDFARWREAERERQVKEELKPPGFEEARARKLELESRILEHELAQLDGSLIRVDEAARVVEGRLETLRSQLLSLPSRMAAACLSARALPEMTAVLDHEVRRMLTELSEAAGTGT